ncbi:5'-nucleotidase /3'-nucleotidase /exopolyphosphatase [Kosakonia oryzendophytica]|uniref:5'-nucleotidase n=1 Tax=Kosakonia oryzendophytica TaxID=1005665 RepID=A0A1C3YZQ0_9ENTR|nr:5'/3'-nucleotidase SurE [Kosakonia oryzendophytica]SCB75549.1 5'-nucleotidase /3'-nucleotidase /exopolyphosphatase [Kosakonia oryzendophytica]
MNKPVLALLLTSLTAAHTQAAEQAMRILLVNDDGCESPGTTSLQEKLAAKGYDVWMVAPTTNQSGIGSAITFKPNKIFDVKKVAEKRYCFPGTPADSLDFGLLGVLRDIPPDLVISGVNDGPNTGVAQLNSGTVGAAARAVRYGFPAIAASIGYLFTAEEMKAGWPSTHQYWPESVDYLVSLVDRLHSKWQPGQPVLPVGSGLSINYPPLVKSAIKGEKYIGNERFPAPQHYYKLLDDGRAQQVMSEKVLMPTEADTDTGWLNKGYITWTLLDGEWDAPQYESQYKALFR